jgi:hypothetical protein
MKACGLRLPCALVLWLWMTAACASPGACAEATQWQPRLCPAGLPQVRAVTVLEQGRGSEQASGSGQPFADCSKFTLSPALVRRYFTAAQRVVDARGESAVERGPCHATGTLRFADGRRAQWRIEQIGSATLQIAGDAAPITLACPRCRFAPFAQR